MEKIETNRKRTRMMDTFKELIKDTYEKEGYSVEFDPPKQVKPKIGVKHNNSVGVRSNTGLGRYDCLNVSGNQVCFEGYVYETKDCLSWHDYSKILNKGISSYFPICLFYGKREGDEVELTYKNKQGEVVNITVVLCQQENGTCNFEDALHGRTDGFGGIYDPSEDSDLSRIKQYCFIITAHEQYSVSVGKNTTEPHKFRFSSCWIKECLEESKKKPKLGYLEKITAAMPNDDSLSPAERLGQALETVKELNKI